MSQAKKLCEHHWQYPSGPISGRDGRDEVVVVRVCYLCGEKQKAFTCDWTKAIGDYALPEHYEGAERKASEVPHE